MKMVQSDDKTIPFLRRLSDLLQENEDIISFQPGIIHNGEFTAGKIVVHDRARVESEVLPKYFNHSSFASLRRQLNYFAFVRIGKSRQRGAIYSNESVVNLKDILRLKRRTVRGSSTILESNETQSKNLENCSITSKSLNLQVTPKLPTTKPGNFRDNVGFDVIFPGSVTLIRSVSQSSEDKLDINYNKRLFSENQEEKKSDVASPIHLPLRKKIKFSYESLVAKNNDIQDSQPHLTPCTVNKISEHNSKFNHTRLHHMEVGVIMGSSLYPNSDNSCIPQQPPEFHHFETASSHHTLSNSFRTCFKQSNLKDDDILAGCNALLALNCDSSRAPYVRTDAYMFTQ